MSTMLRIARYELREALRGRWVIGYGAFFLLVTEALFTLGGAGERVLLSLSSLVLFLVPLTAIVFGTIHLYDSRDFNELLLAQPVSRPQLFGGLYAGVALPLAAAYLAGTGLPFAIHGAQATARTLAVLWVVGTLLTLVFTALAFLIALHFDDRMRGLGGALLVWIAMSVVYDGLVLLLVGAFYDYPLERPLIALMLLNPIDLGRVLILLHFDASALMGYTGAVFERFFSGGWGTATSLGALALWVAAPLYGALRRFRTRDF